MRDEPPSDQFKSRAYIRQVFVNILTPIRGTLAVTLQYSSLYVQNVKLNRIPQRQLQFVF